jgi:hypothetical protein
MIDSTPLDVRLVMANRWHEEFSVVNENRNLHLTMESSTTRQSGDDGRRRGQQWEEQLMAIVEWIQ